MKLLIRQGTFLAYRASSDSVQAELKSLLAAGYLIESLKWAVFSPHILEDPGVARWSESWGTTPE